MEAVHRLLATDRAQGTLVLRGYAGTGKTTLLGALVRTLADQGRRPVLLAPTGRAAKVLAGHAGMAASTIHRRIYKLSGEVAAPGLSLVPHQDANTLFIVDEASMIGTGGGDGPFGGRDLLSDLFEHVFSADGTKLLIVGDPAQLPPVGEERSPALDHKHLRAHYGLLAGMVELKEVVRQEAHSGILSNATSLRSELDREVPTIRFDTSSDDVVRLDGYELQDALEEAYGRHGQDQVCIICRSNKRAYGFNQQVRTRILGMEEEVNGGDRLMVVRNNYLWASAPGRPELIANGETVEVKRVRGEEERYGMRFMDLTVLLPEGEGRSRPDRELDVKVMLDVLASEGSALSAPRSQALQRAVMEEMTATTKRERSALLRTDPYANALQVKYAYAVTCHKAQGGQWASVFVDQGYLTEEMVDREYVRWLYTALTRAVEKVHLVNFHPRFHGDEEA